MNIVQSIPHERRKSTTTRPPSDILIGDTSPASNSSISPLPPLANNNNNTTSPSTTTSALADEDNTQLKQQAASKKKNVSHIPCRFFKAGVCSAGKACPFSHTIPEPGQAKPVCQWFLQGSCKFGHKCILAHAEPGQPAAYDRKNKRAAQLAARKAAAAGIQPSVADLNRRTTSGLSDMMAKANINGGFLPSPTPSQATAAVTTSELTDQLQQQQQQQQQSPTDHHHHHHHWSSSSSIPSAEAIMNSQQQQQQQQQQQHQQHRSAFDDLSSTSPFNNNNSMASAAAAAAAANLIGSPAALAELSVATSPQQRAAALLDQSLRMQQQQQSPPHRSANGPISMNTNGGAMSPPLAGSPYGATADIASSFGVSPTSRQISATFGGTGTSPFSARRSMFMASIDEDQQQNYRNSINGTTNFTNNHQINSVNNNNNNNNINNNNNNSMFGSGIGSGHHASRSLNDIDSHLQHYNYSNNHRHRQVTSNGNGNGNGVGIGIPASNHGDEEGWPDSGGEDFLPSSLHELLTEDEMDRRRQRVASPSNRPFFNGRPASIQVASSDTSFANLHHQHQQSFASNQQQHNQQQQHQNQQNQQNQQQQQQHNDSYNHQQQQLQSVSPAALAWARTPNTIRNDAIRDHQPGASLPQGLAVGLSRLHLDNNNNNNYINNNNTNNNNIHVGNISPQQQNTNLPSMQQHTPPSSEPFVGSFGSHRKSVPGTGASQGAAPTVGSPLAHGTIWGPMPDELPPISSSFDKRNLGGLGEEDVWAARNNSSSTTTKQPQTSSSLAAALAASNNNATPANGNANINNNNQTPLRDEEHETLFEMDDV